MEDDGCPGVGSLSGQLVLYTGRTFVGGIRTDRVVCARMASTHGARQAPNMSRWVTMLVLGELEGQHVVDPIRQHSQKVVDIHARRQAGHHVHVVDGNGFSSLLRGEPAPCLRLNRPSGSQRIEVSPGLPVSSIDATPSVGSILGDPLTPRALPNHRSVELEFDLDALDRGTAAHEATIAALIRYLDLFGMEASRPAPTMPRFDVGWSDWVDNDVLFIAEVKSLTDGSETQQIRLAIGQVLDYVYAVSASPAAAGKKIRPVIVVERQPSDARWVAIAEGAGIVLSWPPEFPKL